MKCTVSCLDLCPYHWYEQPSNEALTCDPQGVYIRMRCTIMSMESVTVTWFMTNNTDDAGLDGMEIMDNGIFSIVPSTTKGNLSFASVVFLAEECTFGYYWCEVTFPSMKMASSAIAAVISNSSLPPCSEIAKPYDPPSNTNNECAVEGFSVSEISSSISPAIHYPMTPTEYSFSPSTTVSEVLLEKRGML